MEHLKLVALDADDIEVVSAHVQDAVLKAADVHWRPAERRLVLGLDRFDWTAAHGASPEYRRCRSVLRFDRVLSCKCKSVDCTAKDAALHLLAVRFEPKDAPGGAVMLTFAGGATLRLEVECLEAELSDLGPAWASDGPPVHAAVAPSGEAFKQG